jgi:hypothetical protein
MEEGARVDSMVGCGGGDFLLVIAAFWVTYLVRYVIPIVPLKPALEHYIEQYGGNFMFLYAIFIFFGDLSDKMIFLFQGEPSASA